MLVFLILSLSQHFTNFLDVFLTSRSAVVDSDLGQFASLRMLKTSDYFTSICTSLTFKLFPGWKHNITPR